MTAATPTTDWATHFETALRHRRTAIIKMVAGLACMALAFAVPVLSDSAWWSVALFVALLLGGPAFAFAAGVSRQRGVLDADQ